MKNGIPKFLSTFVAVKLRTNLILSLILALCVSFVLIRNLRSANSFKLPVLTSMDSTVFKMHSLKNKVCIVSYFQTWCSDCVKEQPDLQKLQDRFGDSICILMVSDEPIEKINAFRNKFSSKLGFYHTNSSLKKDLGVKAYPTTYLLDKKKNVVLSKVEGIHWFTPEIVKSIAELLKN